MMAILAFVFGLIIGSFLNVLIHRLPKVKSILGYSRCPKCSSRISWVDNLPILSFIFLKGRCRTCKKRISWQYPVIEAMTGFLFLFSFLIYGSEPLLFGYIVFLVSLFVVIALIDSSHFLILDQLLLIGFLIALVALLANFYFPFLDCRIFSCSLSGSSLGILSFAGILFLIFFWSKGKWIGFGDVKLAAMAGLIFGFPNSVNLFYLTFITGFFIAIILLVLKRASLGSQLPLGAVISSVAILFLLTGLSIFDLINSDLILRIFI